MRDLSWLQYYVILLHIFWGFTAFTHFYFDSICEGEEPNIVRCVLIGIFFALTGLFSLVFMSTMPYFLDDEEE